MNEDDEPGFADLVPGVKRLQNDRVGPYRQRGGRQTFEHRARFEREPQEARADSADHRGQEAYFHSGLQRKLQRRIRQGQFRPEASLDLHGCRQHEALEMLECFFADAARHGLRMLIVIHGRGLRSRQDAVLKPLVQRWLGSQNRVLAWCPAQARDGGPGASYVYLRASMGD